MSTEQDLYQTQVDRNAPAPRAVSQLSNDYNLQPRRVELEPQQRFYTDLASALHHAAPYIAHESNPTLTANHGAYLKGLDTDLNSNMKKNSSGTDAALVPMHPDLNRADMMAWQETSAESLTMPNDADFENEECLGGPSKLVPRIRKTFTMFGWPQSDEDPYSSDEENDIDVEFITDNKSDPYEHLPPSAHYCYGELQGIMSSVRNEAMAHHAAGEQALAINNLRTLSNKFLFAIETAGLISQAPVYGTNQPPVNPIRPLGVFFVEDLNDEDHQPKMAEKIKSWVASWYRNVHRLMYAGGEFPKCPPIPIIVITEGKNYSVNFCVDIGEDEGFILLYQGMPMGNAVTYKGLCIMRNAIALLTTYLRQVYKPWLARIHKRASGPLGMARTALSDI